MGEVKQSWPDFGQSWLGFDVIRPDVGPPPSGSAKLPPNSVELEPSWRRSGQSCSASPRSSPTPSKVGRSQASVEMEPHLAEVWPHSARFAPHPTLVCVIARAPIGDRPGWRHPNVCAGPRWRLEKVDELSTNFRKCRLHFRIACWDARRWMPTMYTIMCCAQCCRSMLLPGLTFCDQYGHMAACDASSRCFRSRATLFCAVPCGRQSCKPPSKMAGTRTRTATRTLSAPASTRSSEVVSLATSQKAALCVVRRFPNINERLRRIRHTSTKYGWKFMGLVLSLSCSSGVSSCAETCRKS